VSPVAADRLNAQNLCRQKKWRSHVYGINRVARGKAQGDQSDSSSAIADFLVSDEADLFIFFNLL
jgi:hypothetical protein